MWLWDEWPGRWGPDAGIDLVAQEHNGDLWAIQAKAYDPKNTITKRDIDTFLSESARPEFTYRLLIATTNRLSQNGERAMDAQEKPVGRILLSGLEKSSVIWPDSPDDLRAPKPKRFKPRKHQREAIRDVLSGFEDSDRGQMLMACGTGKTLVALWIAEGLEATRTLVLVPSLSLLSQTLGEWNAHAAGEFVSLPVCSDDTVRGKDELVSHTGELGLPATTDPSQIAGFLRKRGRRVMFATYQSSSKIAEAYAEGQVPGFDLVIADEAHRCAGRVGSDFTTVLDSAAVKAKRRLFMTATPRFYTGRVKRAATDADLEIASMDDERAFGPVFHTLPFGEAIERDLLSDYQVVIIGVDDPMVRKYVDTARLVEFDDGSPADAHTLAAHVGLAKAFRNYDLHRTISFHSRVESAQRFASRFPTVVEWMPDDEQPDGEIVTGHVSGAMPAGQRAIRLDELRDLEPNERGLLSNARCLSEGVDVPTLDGVAFIDPKRSQVDIVQAVGRAIRKAEGKRLGTIVIPVFISDPEDPESALEGSPYRPIWGVLKALRAHDDLLAEALDDCRRSLGATGGAGTLPHKIVLDLPGSVDEAFVHALETRLVEQSTADWEFWYGLLERYVERESLARVPSRYREGDLRLGSWVSSQRAFYASGKLTPERISRLDAVAGWVWDAQEAAWDVGVGYLEQFAVRERHAHVPGRHREAGYPLGSWVNARRRAYANDELEPERVERLEAVEGWTWDANVEAWEAGFSALERFVAREGHTTLSARHVEDGYRVGQWTSIQRALHARGQLDLDRAARLEALDSWTWTPKENVWDEMCALVEAFAAIHGHSLVPALYVEDGLKLGQWVSRQRQDHRAGDLTAERAGRLDALPDWSWDPKGDAWNTGCASVERFVAREGHALVPYKHLEDGFNLGSWVAVQRTSRRQDQLSSDRVARLDALPGWSWDPKGDAWEAGFANLQRFLAGEGHALVPKACVEEGFKLGQWVNNQRARKNSLTRDRVARLDALPGWSWASTEDAWEAAFASLERFAAREGHALVPWSHVEDEFKLGRWVVNQRALKRRGKVPPGRLACLEGVPGWTWETRYS